MRNSTVKTNPKNKARSDKVLKIDHIISFFKFTKTAKRSTYIRVVGLEKAILRQQAGQVEGVATCSQIASDAGLGQGNDPHHQDFRLLPW